MAVSVSQDKPPSEPRHLVVLVHGINTRALWFGNVKPELEDAGFIVAPAGYELFGVLRFLLPFDRLRRGAIRRVTTKIRLARQLYPDAKMSVIAHSFGSFVMARVVQSEFDIKWHRIILCGSVVREDFPLEQFLQRFDAPIVNEIGTRDCWPAIARAITWGYGSVGSYGFQSPAVTDRWHKDFRHSDFLTREFCQRFWVPFLRDGTVKRADSPSPLPTPCHIITRIPLRWVLLCALVVVPALVLARTAPWEMPWFSEKTIGGKGTKGDAGQPATPFTVWVAREAGAPARHVVDDRKLAQARTPAAFRELLTREVGGDLANEGGLDGATVFRVADRAVLTPTQGDPTGGGNRMVLVIPNRLLQRFNNDVIAFNYFKAQLPE